MNNQITYTDKVALNDNPLIPDINKCKADDMNEIKAKHNGVMDGSIPMGNIVVDSIRSKNMFNKDTVQRNKFIPTDSTSETLSDYTDTYTTDWIPCKPSTTYVISGTQVNRKRCQFKNAGGTITYGEATGSNVPYTITTPNDAVYFRIYFCAEIANATFTDVQIEKGNTATSYSPYQNLNGYDIYSRGEMRIGTWIDGKPLYRKVYEISISSLTSSVDTDITALNMDTLVNIYGTTIQGTYKRNVFNTYAYSGTLSEWSGVFINGTTLTFRNYNLAVTKAYMILEYTKTTD